MHVHTGYIFSGPFFEFKAWGASGARSRSSSPQAALIMLDHGSLDFGDSNVFAILSLNIIESCSKRISRGVLIVCLALWSRTKQFRQFIVSEMGTDIAGS